MTEVPVPSYRVRHSDDDGPPWRLIAIGGGLAATLLLGAALVWGIGRMGGGPRSVPLIEPDPRPIKVRPDDPGGLRVPNQDELIFDRNRGAAPNGGARLAPEPEAPRIDALRAQVAQPAPRPATPNPPAGEPAGATAPGTAPAPRTAPGAAPQATPAQPAAAPQPAGAAQAPAARPAPAPGGTIRVQLGALASEEAARGEWDRLARRHADLLGAFRPQVARFEREGQAPLFRLRTGGFADIAAASGFCEQARARSIPCTVIR